MDIQENIQLAPYTTFKIGGRAEYFTHVASQQQLQEALSFAREKHLPVFVLGWGSNVLISEAGVKGLVIQVALNGKKVINDTPEYRDIEVAAGEGWSAFVGEQSELWGIENLIHIPGSVGAVAVQNVGAYGQEASETIVKVTAVNIATGEQEEFGKQDCNFSYRSSRFNSTDKGKFIITSIVFRLSKTLKPVLTYGDLTYLGKTGSVPTLAQIHQAVTEVRDKKFPYPHEAKNGNAGSFFKAHTISIPEFEELLEKVEANFGPEAVHKLHSIASRLKVAQGVKVPYGFLIECTGLKGKQFGNVAVCPTHAGVLLNATGTALSKEVLDLFSLVRRTVYQKTGVVLQNEPELVGFSDRELEDAFKLG